METLIDVLCQAAKKCKEGNTHTIRVFMEKGKYREITYELLYMKAGKFASALREQGVQKKDYIIFQINDISTYLYSFWACQMIGAIPVPLPVEVNKCEETEAISKIKNVSKILQNAYLLHDGMKESSYYGKMGIEENRIIDGASMIRESDTYMMLSEYNVDREDVAWIQFSSGSTSTPKGVVLKHKNIIKDMEQISERLQLEGTQNCANWMPLTHDMGFIAFHLMPLKHNSNATLFSPVLFMKDPFGFLKEVSECKAEMVGLSNSLIELFIKMGKMLRPDMLDLSNLRYILNGAEPVNCASARQFLEIYGQVGLRSDAMCFCYGMAEASLAISIARGDVGSIKVDRTQFYKGKVVPVKEDGIEVALLGKVLKDLEVLILDDDGTILPDDCIGEIAIRGENVMDGYLGMDREGFFNQEGFFLTGDKGFLHDGYLAVSGRVKDIIFRNGSNYYSHDLETIVSQLYPKLLNQCAAVQMKNLKGRQSLILFVTRDIVHFDKEMQSSINKEMMRQVGFIFEQFLFIDKLPRTSSGKIQRFKLLEEYEQKQNIRKERESKDE